MATTLTPLVVYGVVDLYGMAVKVTIVHNHNHSDRLRRNNAIMRALSPDVGRRAMDAGGASEPEPERLLFHPNCGQKAAIINEGRTALRPQYVSFVMIELLNFLATCLPRPVVTMRTRKMPTAAPSGRLPSRSKAPTAVPKQGRRKGSKKGTGLWVV